MLRRLFLTSLILMLASTSTAGTFAQTATPGADPVTEDHLEWILGLFDGDAVDLTEADVEARFDQAFLDSVPAGELIATVQTLATQLGPLTQVDDQSREPGEFVGVFEAESGDHVMIAIAVDPESGLMSAFFVAPAEAPAPAATPAATPDASSMASPAASPVAASPLVDDPEAQMALHDDLVADIRAVSDPVIDAVLAGDHETLLEYVSPEIADVFQGVTIAEVTAGYTSNQVQLVFPEEGAYLFGQWNETGIQGVVIFGVGDGAVPFELQPEEPQDGDQPSGRFSGAMYPAQAELSVEFSTDTDGSLAATLDIPALGAEDQELADVQYLGERPIGELVDESVLAHGGVNTLHRADFAWGDHLLRVSVAVDVDSQQVISLQVLPAVPAPPAAPDAPEAQAAYHLPFEGLWWVFWGGDTQLTNYHAEVSSQRYAYDVVIWKDGATFQGDGTSNEDYWAWGQPVFAPADGTVVDVVNDLPDIEPNLPPDQRDAANPAGNHVVIETAEREYVFIGHLQQGSVQVAIGDEVNAGDQLGLTGNSGNTSEPHIHIHVQDSPDVLDFEASGIPLVFESAVVDGEHQEDAVPLQGSFVAPE